MSLKQSRSPFHFDGARGHKRIGRWSPKIVSSQKLAGLLKKRRGERIVFTNGVYDLLHAGHVSLLRKAKQLGDCLVVGINSDASVRRLKGPARPLAPLEDRVSVLAALE